MKPLLHRSVALFVTLLLASVSLWASACDLRCATPRLGEPCCAPSATHPAMPGMSHTLAHSHAHQVASPHCLTCVAAVPDRAPAADPAASPSGPLAISLPAALSQHPPLASASPDRSPPLDPISRSATTPAPLRL